MLNAIFKPILLARLSHYLALAYRANGHQIKTSTDEKSLQKENTIDDYVYRLGQQIIHAGHSSQHNVSKQFFPEQIAKLIENNCSRGKLYKLFRRLHNIYYQKTNHSIKFTYKIMEPILVIWLALTLAYFGITILFPNFYG